MLAVAGKYYTHTVVNFLCGTLLISQRDGVFNALIRSL